MGLQSHPVGLALAIFGLLVSIPADGVLTPARQLHSAGAFELARP